MTIIKVAFCSQFFTKLFKLDSQSSNTIRLSLLDNNGIRATRLINLDTTYDIDLHTFFEFKTKFFENSSPNRRLNNSSFILKRKILVTRAATKIGNLSRQIYPL